MTTTEQSAKIGPRAALARLGLVSVLAAGVLAGVGYWPTTVVAGADGVRAMVMGVGLALVATLIGLVPSVLTLRLGPRERLSALLGGMAIRFVLVLGALLAVLLGHFAAPLPLAIWTVIGYIVLLTIDTVGVAWLTRQAARTRA